ncbi:hypothetical protein FDZ59_03785 [Ehrlichia ruminantium]|nr:hypothetical protein FDZ59_03785 [Ehrlichia ruminantium]
MNHLMKTENTHKLIKYTNYNHPYNYHLEVALYYDIIKIESHSYILGFFSVTLRTRYMIIHNIEQTTGKIITGIKVPS